MIFHTCAVKIAKIQAHSGPNKLPGKSLINPVTVKAKKLNTGTACKTSMAGMIICSARRFFAAQDPKIMLATSEKNNATNIRRTVLSAYSGKTQGDKDKAMGWPRA